jgi:hypothetical protein
MAAQVQEAPIPNHLVAFAASDDRAEIVVHALARHPAQPLERTHVPLQKRLQRQVEREERRLRTRIRQRREQRIHAPLPTRHGRPGRHLRPVELQHLPRPIPGPLRRTHRRRTQPLHVLLHETHRPRVAVLVAQDLRQPRRPDPRPLLQQPQQHRPQRIELRPRRRPPIARRLGAPRESSHSPPIHPQPPSDLALRDPVRHQRPHPRPLQRAPHLRTSRSTTPTRRASKATRTRSATQQVVHFSITDSGAVLGCAHHAMHHA